MCFNFQEKRTTLTFSAQIWSKKDFRVEISKIWVQIRNLYLQYTICTDFQLKWTTLNFAAKIWGNCPIACNILVLITSKVLQKAGWRLKWAAWRWMELGEDWNELGWSGWRWMEVGSRFSNIENNSSSHVLLNKNCC